MFRRFDRLVPIFNLKQDTLSLYGDIMSYAFFNKKVNKNIEPKEIPPKEKWENRDFKIKDKKEEIKTNTKIPYRDQWETRDFYVPNKRYDVVVLNDKTVTYQDYIQQLFLLDKENREKNKK